VSFVLIPIASIATAALVLRSDVRRRRLSLTRAAGWRVFSALDLGCPAATAGFVAGRLIKLIPIAVSERALPLNSPTTWACIAGVFIGVFIWGEGRRQINFQRPDGIVFGEWLILAGAYKLIESALFAGLGGVPHGRATIAICVVTIFGGAIIIAAIVRPFVKGNESHRIIDRLVELGESAQAEYTPPTAECPHPKLWRMLDSKSSELEVAELLKSLVMTVKPRLIVETGTFIGCSTIKMAEGLQANGFGHIITIENDPLIFAKAKERIKASGLEKWIECRNESSLETRIDGTIDFLFSDSYLPIREQEIRRFLPQVDPRGLILIHDASSHFRVVREAALRLEQEGLISTVLLPTPRGLVVAQKHEGRQ
jgi:predicted O-methyltransferase YrrM